MLFHEALPGETGSSPETFPRGTVRKNIPELGTHELWRFSLSSVTKMEIKATMMMQV